MYTGEKLYVFPKLNILSQYLMHTGESPRGYASFSVLIRGFGISITTKFSFKIAFSFLSGKIS